MNIKELQKKSTPQERTTVKVSCLAHELQALNALGLSADTIFNEGVHELYEQAQRDTTYRTVLSSTTISEPLPKNPARGEYGSIAEKLRELFETSEDSWTAEELANKYGCMVTSMYTYLAQLQKDNIISGTSTRPRKYFSVKFGDPELREAVNGAKVSHLG